MLGDPWETPEKKACHKQTINICFLSFLLQIRSYIVQKAAVRLQPASNEHQDCVQGQLQIRGAGKSRH